MGDSATRASGGPASHTLVQFLRALIRRGLMAWGLVALMGNLSPAAGNQLAMTDLLEGLGLSGYPLGTKPPAFVAHTAEGETVTLTELRGRVVLLNFWATWCQQCRPEMPVFDRLHRALAPQGLTVIGVNLREGVPAIRRYTKELGLTFPLLLDRKGKITASYGVIGLPTTFLIGRDGRAVALAVGPRDWASAPATAIIQALLAELAE